MNADNLASTGQGIVGHNMFAYCGNDPAICADESWQRYSNTTALGISGSNLLLKSLGKIVVGSIIVTAKNNLVRILWGYVYG